VVAPDVPYLVTRGRSAVASGAAEELANDRELSAVELERQLPRQALHRAVGGVDVLQVDHDVDAGARAAVGVPHLRADRSVAEPLRLVEHAEEDLEVRTVSRREELAERATEEAFDLGERRVDLAPIAAVTVPDVAAAALLVLDPREHARRAAAVVLGPERGKPASVEFLHRVRELVRNDIGRRDGGAAALEILGVAGSKIAPELGAMLDDRAVLQVIAEPLLESGQALHRWPPITPARHDSARPSGSHGRRRPCPTRWP